VPVAVVVQVHRLERQQIDLVVPVVVAALIIQDYFMRPI
jgi:hypothetical protein